MGRTLVLPGVLTFAVLSIAFAVASGRRLPAARDLPQDYVAARAWLEGTSPYRPLDDLYQRFGFPLAADDVMVPCNPHPPAAILLAAPFALLDYRDAVAVLLWVQLAALALTWAASYELFRPHMNRWAWALAGGAFGLWTPVWEGLAWGQPVGLLALAILGVWRLARVHSGFWFGLLLSATILVRPFVALLAVLAARLPPKQRGFAAVGLVIGGTVPFAAVGVWPWEWVRLASHAGGYVPGCGSLPGVLHLGAAGGVLCFGIAFVALACLSQRGLSLDSLAALACVSAFLTYPLSWFQYDTCLIPAAAWVIARISIQENRPAMGMLLVYFLLRTIPDLMPGASGDPMIEWAARYKNWLQVIARGFLLVAAALVSLQSKPTCSAS